MYETRFVGALPSDKLAMVGGGVSLLEVDGVIGSFFVILDLREDGKNMSFLRSGQEHVGGVVVVFWVSLDSLEVDDSVVVSYPLGELLELLGNEVLFSGWHWS